MIGFVATGALTENEIVAACWLVTCAARAVFEKGELCPCAAGKPDEVDLRCVGKASADQHLAPRGMPVSEYCRAKFGVAVDLFRHRHRDSWNAFGYKIISRRHYVVLRDNHR